MANEQSISTCEHLRVRLIGVGGAGCHVAEHIFRTELGRIPVSIVHTHARVLQQHSIERRLLIGSNRTHGLGSGGDADLARVMADEAATELRELVGDADLVFSRFRHGRRHRNGCGSGHRENCETGWCFSDRDRHHTI